MDPLNILITYPEPINTIVGKPDDKEIKRTVEYKRKKTEAIVGALYEVLPEDFFGDDKNVKKDQLEEEISQNKELKIAKTLV